MDAFAAVANPTRRQLLDLLRHRPLAAGALGAAFPNLAQPAISRHLRLLREAGLVSSTRRAQERIYTLRPDGLTGVDAWLSHYRAFWPARLEALDAHLRRPRPRTVRRSP